MYADPSTVVSDLAAKMASTALGMGRTNLIVGVSGGIDSAVSLALAVKAFGSKNVRAVAMPERENSPESLRLAKALAGQLGTNLDIVDLTAALEALGCYRRRDSVIRSLFPSYDANTCTVTVAAVQDIKGSRLPAFSRISIVKSDGSKETSRLNATAYSELFAASNLKQRLRALTLYDFADRYRGAVVGTSNLDETYLGFFVRLGDGSWDISPLDTFTKTRIYELAAELDIPEEIIGRQTTTDTFPNAGQSQTSMFYGLPFEELDVLLEVLTGKREVEDARRRLGWSEAEMSNSLHNLERRHVTTRWNRAEPVKILS